MEGKEEWWEETENTAESINIRKDLELMMHLIDVHRLNASLT